MTLGLMIIVLNLGYLGLSIFIGIVLSQLLLKKTTLKTWKRRVLCTLVSISVLVAPFWDLLIQKGIKTYYETYKMDDTIYAYPERDKDGKIESLGVGRFMGTQPVSYLLSQDKLKKFLKEFSIDIFVEYFFFGSLIKHESEKGEMVYKEDYKYDLGYVRVHFNQDPISYEKIKDETEFQARYQVLTRMEKHYFFEEIVIEFWDKKRDVLLSKGSKIRFPIKDAEKKFRTKYLLWWMNASGGSFELKGLDNTSAVAKKLFSFSL